MPAATLRCARLRARARATSRSWRRSASGRRCPQDAAGAGARDARSTATSRREARVRCLRRRRAGARVDRRGRGAAGRAVAGRGLRGRGRCAGATARALDVDADRALLRLDDGRDALPASSLSARTARSRSCARRRGIAAERKRLRPERGGGELPLRKAAPQRRLSMVSARRGARAAAAARATMCRWSGRCRPKKRAESPGLDGEALCREVDAAARGEVGRAGAGHAAPQLSAARLSAQPAGGAARRARRRRRRMSSIPLAGQGLNLGLQDARALAAVLAAREPHARPGRASPAAPLRAQPGRAYTRDGHHGRLAVPDLFGARASASRRGCAMSA